MIRIAILVLTLFLALPAYAQVCPGGSTCQTLGTVITGTSQNVAPSSGDVVPTVHGTTVQNIPTQQLLAGPTVANLTALRAACTSTSGCPSGHFVFPNGVTRLTDGVAGASPLYFTIGSGACSTDDGASCVNSADGNQWDGVFPSSGVDVREWSAPGDGATDATTAFQAAMTVTCKTGVKLTLGNGHYLISSTLNGPGSPYSCNIEGINGNVDVYATACPANAGSIIVNSNINAVILSESSDTFRNICFQMATSSGTRTSGWALISGGTSTTQQGHSVIENNTVINAYNGISIGIPSGIGGYTPTNGSTQTNSDIVRNNTVTRASNISLANGLASTNASTNGTEWRGNQVTCFGAGGPSSIGMWFGDGGAFVDGTNGGAYDCGIGLEISEGTGQVLGGGEFESVLCDTSVTYCTLIDSTGGTVYLASFGNFWMGGNTNATGPTLQIQDTSAAFKVHNLSFVGGIIQVQSSSAAGGPLDAINITGDVFNVLISNNQINGNSTLNHDIGLSIGGSAQEMSVNSNIFTQIGSQYLASDIVLTTSGDLFTFQANNWGTAGGPSGGGGNGFDPLNISAWTSATRRMTWGGGVATDSNVFATQSVVSNEISQNSYHAFYIANAVATATLMNEWWYGRQEMINAIGSNVITFSTGGTATGGYIPFCNATTLSGSGNFLWAIGDYNGGSPCWHLK